MIVATGLVVFAAACSNGDDAGHLRESSISAALVLSPAGDTFGPIDVATPFDADAIEALFPGSTVSAATGMSEGIGYPLLRVSLDTGSTTFNVRSEDGEAIHSIEIIDATPVVNLGLRNGASFAEIFMKQPAPACSVGIEEFSGSVLCASPYTEHITVMLSGEWDGPDDVMPPPDALREWKVDRIFWRP